jgi:hypothetical protein
VLLRDLEDAPFQRENHRLGAIPGPEFAEQTLDVKLHRAFGDLEPVPDLLIRKAFRHHLEDLQFSFRKVGKRDALLQGRLNLRGDCFSALMNGPYGRQNFPAAHLFQQVRPSPGQQGTVNILFSVLGRQHDDTGIWKPRTYFPGRLDSAHSRHAQIHEHNLGPVLSKQLDRLKPVFRLGHYLHVRLRGNHGPQSVPHERVVIGYQYSDHARIPEH